MKPARMLLLFLLLPLAGCSLLYASQIPIQYSLRITAPMDDSHVLVGQPVRFAVHMANVRAPSTGVLIIEGPQSTELPFAFQTRGRGFQVAEVLWTPEEEGKYKAKVRAFLNGEERRGGNEITVWVDRSHAIQARPTLAATRIPPTPLPTPTARPSSTPTATPTQVVSPTATPRPCWMAKFVADVTIPDGTALAAGQAFTKTWRLQNVGSCSWPATTALVFDSGDRMGASDAVALGAEVAPGQSVDVSIELRAPTEPGSYRGYFKLRSPQGVIFGLGPEAKPFYVDIVVPEPTATATPTPRARPTATWTPTATPTPADTQGPAVKASRDTNQVYWPPYCRPSTVTIRAAVHDPSGVARVVLHYRVLDPKSRRTGTWVDKPFTLVGTDRYEVTLTDADLTASLNPPLNVGPGSIEYQIWAWDRVGNASRVEQPDITLTYCIY